MVPRLPRILTVGAFLCALGFVRAAHADPRGEFEKARASFLAHNWTDAEQRFRALLDPESGLKERTLISQARMYLGATLISEGKRDEAQDLFGKLVIDDPSFEPDPLSYPGEAINTFIDVRQSMLAQIRTEMQNRAKAEADRLAREAAEKEAQRVWIERVKAQAAEEKITVRHNRVVACLPFGVGQYQNGDVVLGSLFLGAQVAAVAGSTITYGMYLYARSRENEELNRPGSDVNQLVPQWHNRAEDLRLVNLGFAGAFVLVAGLGILQANIAYVPEVAEKKRRDLPPLETPGRTARSATAPRSPLVTSLAPTFSPLAGERGGVAGAMVGVTGLTF